MKWCRCANDILSNVCFLDFSKLLMKCLIKILYRQSEIIIIIMYIFMHYFSEDIIVVS